MGSHDAAEAPPGANGHDAGAWRPEDAWAAGKKSGHVDGFLEGFRAGHAAGHARGLLDADVFLDEHRRELERRRKVSPLAGVFLLVVAVSLIVDLLDGRKDRPRAL